MILVQLNKAGAVSQPCSTLTLTQGEAPPAGLSLALSLCPSLSAPLSVPLSRSLSLCPSLRPSFCLSITLTMAQGEAPPAGLAGLAWGLVAVVLIVVPWEVDP